MFLPFLVTKARIQGRDPMQSCVGDYDFFNPASRDTRKDCKRKDAGKIQ
jgi:hypothetical protein